MTWRASLRATLLGLLLLGGPSCSVLGAPSRVRAGELYAPGSARYDEYFAQVHAQQVTAAAWATDRVGARKPLLDALKLPGESDDLSITQATKDRLRSGGLRLDVQGSDVHVVEASTEHTESPRGVLVALEQSAHAEITRAAKLAEVPDRILSLAKTGQELEAHIAEDFAGDGQKPFDVKMELHASFEALQQIADGARRERQVASQFVQELGRAVSTGNEIPAVAMKAGGAPSGSKAASPPKASPHPAVKVSAPSPAPAARPEPVAAAPARPPPPPPPKPAPPAASEVFNP